MCKRACNLCVGLYWSITKWSDGPCFPLALGRVSSHPVECHFGTTRSTLDGDTRWDSFFNAEIGAILIRRSIVHLGLRPYIRRFRTEAGCTLTGEGKEIAQVTFGWTYISALVHFAKLLAQGDELFAVNIASLIQPFRKLATSLAEVGWHERAGKSSLLSGGCITLRLFTLSKRSEEGEPTPETTDLLSTLADE
jgi:hypothetical protein